jgi:hypothetical protein
MPGARLPMRKIRDMLRLTPLSVALPGGFEATGRCRPEDCGAPGAMLSSSPPSRIRDMSDTPNITVALSEGF